MALNLFSGRRREGDLQRAFETRRPGARERALPLDAVVDPTVGDPTDSEVIRKWTVAIEARQDLAVAAGPPCETWSAARQEAPMTLACAARGPKPPRPIRTWERIRGSPTASAKERAQLSLASALYRTTLHVAQATACAGGATIAGHSARARRKPQAASSRGLAETCALARHPGAQTVTFGQCVYGAAAQEAINYLAAHAPPRAARGDAAHGPSRPPRPPRWTSDGFRLSRGHH